MKTIILPGYSPHNRQWAIDIKKSLSLNHEILIHEWRHWPPTRTPGSENLEVRRRASGSERLKGSFSLPREMKSILTKVGKGKVNIIAKSVGTRVAMRLASEIPQQINKVILCGIPTKGYGKTAENIYSMGLSAISPTRVIVFQNTKDPFASFSDIKKFIGRLNLKIKIVEKLRKDHHYPYSPDFQKFLG